MMSTLTLRIFQVSPVVCMLFSMLDHPPACHSWLSSLCSVLSHVAHPWLALSHFCAIAAEI